MVSVALCACGNTIAVARDGQWVLKHRRRWVRLKPGVGFLDAVEAYRCEGCDREHPVADARVEPYAGARVA